MEEDQQLELTFNEVVFSLDQFAMSWRENKVGVYVKTKYDKYGGMEWRKNNENILAAVKRIRSAEETLISLWLTRERTPEQDHLMQTIWQYLRRTDIELEACKNREDIPEGRVTVQASVFRFWDVETDHGLTIKMECLEDRGYTFEATVPKSIIATVQPYNRVQLDIRMHRPNSGRRYHGIGSRPTKAKIL